ncbi:MAG: choice-of-anchor Q domain-containing protein, partial [Burkholderiales bacterium]
GGIFNNNGTLTVTNSTIASNRITIAGGAGGGIFNNNGTLTVTNSTISGNESGSNGAGGGILSSGTLTLTNSTISGNTSSSGGGIYHGVDTLYVTNSTISSNTSNFGGGIANFATVNSRNSIIAGNTASGSPDFYGPLTTQGNNLIGNDSGATIVAATGDQIGTSSAPINPMLEILADNGGPTQTHALLSGSTAIDAGNDCVLDNSCTPPLGVTLTTDQRGTGFARKVGAKVDIGAFEVQEAADTTPPTCTVTVTPSTLSPPNHKLVNIITNVSVSDSDSGPNGFKLLSVTSSEADAGLGSDDMPIDIQGWIFNTADTSGQLRSERFAKAGRTYTITYQASDVAGNTANCSTTVTVPKGK